MHYTRRALQIWLRPREPTGRTTLDSAAKADFAQSQIDLH